MPTAVLDLEFAHLPREITGLERYHEAYILIRLQGVPITRITVPVLEGRIDGVELRSAAIQAGGWQLWETWLHQSLEWDQILLAHNPVPLSTIAICTRDRPHDARRCLEALSRLEEDGQELLVIDNCPSTDDTRRVVETFPRVRYVREDIPGLNVARNRALKEAAHDIVVFTDDDAAPDRGWLRALVRNFNDPLVYCVTGLTLPMELETEAQEWHERYSTFSRGFKRRSFERASINPMAAGQIGAGVNMAMRKSAMALVGPFDEALDAGTRTRSGGDSEMFSRLLAAGCRIVYEPRAVSWHRHRRSWTELRKMIHGYGVGVYAAWTRSFLVEHEWSMFRLASRWFFETQLPNLFRSAFWRSSPVHFDLGLLELRGCLAGPWHYLASRAAVRKRIR
jgi:glycosyltransferase involved in cell wall biosynthesis